MIQRLGSTPNLTNEELGLADHKTNEEGASLGQPRMVSGFEPVKQGRDVDETFSDNTESGTRPIPWLVQSTQAKNDTASDFIALLEFPSEAQKSAVPGSAVATKNPAASGSRPRAACVGRPRHAARCTPSA